MNNKPIILLFEENELNISALYSLYAQKISHKKSFWERLSREEVAHAAHLGNERGHIDAIIENKFSRGVINYVMEYVLEETKKAQKNSPSHEAALSSALRIERSMLEKKCFEMFKPSDVKVQRIMRKLNNDTDRHIQMLTKELAKQK